MDAITYDTQTTDRSYGRSAADADAWGIMNPTPGQDNE
jgi:hypothetical protein